MVKYILGFISALIVMALGVYLYMVSGFAPVATSAPPMPFEKFLAKTALHAALRRYAPKTHTTSASSQLLIEGADTFRKHCAVCHGLPGQSPTAIAMGMFPPPPQLFTNRGMVTDDPVGVTYWKVKHGIRLTGMPGFERSIPNEQIWALSLLLHDANHLTPTLLAELTVGPPKPEVESAKPKGK